MPLGDFVWYDLITRDGKSAGAFYSNLMGWTIKDMPTGTGAPYPMIILNDRQLGGIMEEKTLLPDVPAHWLAYVEVASVDEATGIARKRGASVRVAPTDIPNIGRFSVIVDPQGALVALFQSLPGKELPKFQPADGAFGWTELWARDVETAKEFYTEVAGWTYNPYEMGANATYWIAMKGDMRVGGMMKMPETGGPANPMWLPYLLVNDADDMTKKAKSLGATVIRQPEDIPGVGRFSVVKDPTGAAVSLFKPNPM